MDNDLVVVSSGENFRFAPVVAKAEDIAVVLGLHDDGLALPLDGLFDLPQNDPSVVSTCETTGIRFFQ